MLTSERRDQSRGLRRRRARGLGGDVVLEVGAHQIGVARRRLVDDGLEAIASRQAEEAERDQLERLASAGLAAM
jgi:hypothetical protein